MAGDDDDAAGAVVGILLLTLFVLAFLFVIVWSRYQKCPQCGKYMLDVNGKKGRMLICQDRECGCRKSLSVITNARCPECHKKLEMRGEGDKRAFYCVCGFREKLSDFEKRKQESGAGKRDIAKYMNSKDNKKPASNPLADQLAKWMEENS